MPLFDRLLTLTLLLTSCSLLAHAEEPAPQPPGLTEFVVEVGTFGSYRQARDIRNILNNLSPTRVESHVEPQGGKIYRVLCGRFHSLSKAETFILENRLRKLFPERWVNPVRIDHKDVGPPKETLAGQATTNQKEEEEGDPYTLSANLYCKDKERKGVYRAQFHPDYDIKGSEVTIQVQWECLITDPNAPKTVGPPAETPTQESGELPTYFAISAIGGYANVAATHPTLGDVTPAGFTFGAEASAYTNLFHGIGPLFDYRFTSRRLKFGSTYTSSYDQRLNVGVDLPLGKFLELQPVVGFFSQNFVMDNGAGSYAFNTIYLPQFGLFVKFNILRPHDGVALDLTGKANYIVPIYSGVNSTSSGFQLGGALRTRMISRGNFGGDWFLEFTQRFQQYGGMNQSESNFVGGLTILFAP